VASEEVTCVVAYAAERGGAPRCCFLFFLPTAITFFDVLIISHVTIFLFQMCEYMFILAKGSHRA
jgi:hypothetical protein